LDPVGKWSKMEATSRKKWRLPPELYGATLRFVKAK